MSVKLYKEVECGCQSRRKSCLAPELYVERVGFGLSAGARGGEELSGTRII